MYFRFHDSVNFSSYFMLERIYWRMKKSTDRQMYGKSTVKCVYEICWWYLMYFFNCNSFKLYSDFSYSDLTFHLIWCSSNLYVKSYDIIHDISLEHIIWIYDKWQIVHNVLESINSSTRGTEATPAKISTTKRACNQ